MNIGKNNTQPVKRVLLVESARGAAAVYVCLGHVILIGHLAELFKWGKFIFYPLAFGQEAVFLFFFLSGFSIHYSSHNRPLATLGGVGHYLYLRFRRIYPIFLFAVGLALVLGAITAGMGIISKPPVCSGGMDLAGILFFLSDYHEGSWFSGLANDPALWSLSYEIPYYLVYPVFWWGCQRIGVGRSFGITLLLSVAFGLGGCLQNNHLSNVFSLYWLWAGGALMAEWKLTGRRFILPPAAYYMTLFLCYAISQSVEALAYPLFHWSLLALTIGIVIFSTFTNFQPLKFSKRLLSVGGILMLLLGFILATRHVPTWGRHVFLDARLIFSAVAISLLLVTGRNLASLCRMLAKPFLKTGAISYALYVIHMPVLYFMADVLRHAGASLWWLPFTLLLIFPLAWWLEIIFQARVVGWLDTPRAKLADFF